MTGADRRIYGVDFSGAEAAGRAIWIAEARPGPAGLTIADCRPAADLPDSGVARAVSLAALVRFIAERRDAVFGLDFPFSLPACLIEDARWDDYVLAFTGRHPTPEAFRQACRAATAGRELKRLTDRISKVPFGAYNLRLYRQTYYGIGYLLAPLLRAEAACVLPMHAPADDRAWLMEICPASTLKATGLYSSYKGGGAGFRDARRHILRELCGRGAVAPLRRDVEALIVEQPGGDALDSVVSAVAAWCAARQPAADHEPTALERIEGRVYFAPIGSVPTGCPGRQIGRETGMPAGGGP